MALEKASSIMLTTTGYTEELALGMGLNNSDLDAPHPLSGLQGVSFIVTCILCSMGLICNGFIIVILIRFPNMKTLANNFILNLALADFFFMISYLFMGHQFKVGQWVFGTFLCRLIVPYDAMTQFVVIDFVMIMSVDRYFAICLPIKSMNFRTLRNGRITSGVIWLVAILSTLPMWIYTDHVCFVDKCVCLAKVSSAPIEESNNRWWIIYTVIIGFCVPLVIICICYLLILHQLLINPMQDSSCKNTSRRAARRVAILVICIIIVFILCFLPFYVVQFIITTLESHTNALAISSIITLHLMYSHSIINPIVYTLVGENFRKNIAFICCRRPRNATGMYSRQSSMRTSSFHSRRMRNSLKSTNSNDPAGLRPHNGYYVHLDTSQHRGAREDPV
ncbi:somatostatin receptor type 5-like [Acanthaster planci]|uniref:Somatostatin receptor type 5-like n=1 Tax=Acanthaster planci TaxID=133434 RepID=A0A8B7XHA3_ACAPL|nr:somatostatin receptor type 5-like [Acanthaster planci]